MSASYFTHSTQRRAVIDFFSMSALIHAEEFHLAWQFNLIYTTYSVPLANTVKALTCEITDEMKVHTGKYIDGRIQLMNTWIKFLRNMCLPYVNGIDLFTANKTGSSKANTAKSPWFC